MRSSFRVPAATCFWLNFLSLRACVIASPPVPTGQQTYEAGPPQPRRLKYPPQRSPRDERAKVSCRAGRSLES